MYLICFSHLRWNFVYQRPQHLLSRFAQKYTTYYVEEFVLTEEEDGYTQTLTKEGVIVIVPHLKISESGGENERIQAVIMNLFAAAGIDRYIFWYYTPMALAFTQGFFTPKLIIYDCMDELSAFKFAPPALRGFEQQLLNMADIVFTGGNSLYEAKKTFHPNVHSCPSSIDKEHFQIARYIVQEPADQEKIPHPRLGFYGVLDERLDIELIREAARARPDWHFVLIGPVVKINPITLPEAPNIHYLGAKAYAQLPAYLSGWDIALIPFALNESTQFVSPTKTPEYLAAGIPVISTAIKDVIHPYGDEGLVHIVHSTAELTEKAELELNTHDKSEWRTRVDTFLKDISWDSTWNQMNELIKNALPQEKNTAIPKDKNYV